MLEIPLKKLEEEEEQQQQQQQKPLLTCLGYLALLLIGDTHKKRNYECRK